MTEKIALLGGAGDDPQVIGHINTDQLNAMMQQAQQESAALQQMSTDPIIGDGMSPRTPADFSNLFPQPVDTTELLTMCEEVSLLNFLPEKTSGLKAYHWQERDELHYASGTGYHNRMGFADGACPEPVESGEGTEYNLQMKLIGALGHLHERDILHADTVAALQNLGIKQIVGGGHLTEGMPGDVGTATWMAERIAGLKEKEMKEQSTLMMNGWDWLLVKGDTSTDSLIFDGVETQVVETYTGSGGSRGAHVNDNSASGTFDSDAFDRFLTEGCAKPQVIMGHSTGIQGLLASYFQHGWQGSQVINVSSGDRVVPGFNFASEVNTGIGRLPVVADDNFTRTDIGGGAFQTSIFPLRMRYFDGSDLIFKQTQIPLSFKDLAPGCLTVRFMVYASTGLVVKDMCAQNRYYTQFTGRIVTTCPVVGFN